MNTNNIAEMKMFFGMTETAWQSLTHSQKLYIMREDMKRTAHRLKESENKSCVVGVETLSKVS